MPRTTHTDRLRDEAARQRRETFKRLCAVPGYRDGLETFLLTMNAEATRAEADRRTRTRAAL